MGRYSSPRYKPRSAVGLAIETGSCTVEQVRSTTPLQELADRVWDRYKAFGESELSGRCEKPVALKIIRRQREAARLRDERDYRNLYSPHWVQVGYVGQRERLELFKEVGKKGTLCPDCGEKGFDVAYLENIGRIDLHSYDCRLYNSWRLSAGEAANLVRKSMQCA